MWRLYSWGTAKDHFLGGRETEGKSWRREGVRDVGSWGSCLFRMSVIREGMKGGGY